MIGKNGEATLEISKVVLKKVNRMTLYDSTISLRGTYLKELKTGSATDVYMPVFTVLFTRAKRWKQSTGALIDECINTVWSIHTMEYYVALKRKENSVPCCMDECGRHSAQ